MIAGLDAGTLTTKVAVREADGSVAVFLPPSVELSGHASTPGAILSMAGDRYMAVQRSKSLDALASTMINPAGRRLGQATGEIEAYVVAAPDAWLDGDIQGAVAWEQVRSLVQDYFGAPAPAWVTQSAAVAAFVAALGPGQRGTSPPSPPPGMALVCDVGAHTLVAALFIIADRTATVIDVEVSSQSSPHRAGAGFDNCALRRAHGKSDDSGDFTDPGLTEAFRIAKRNGTRRATALLPRAAVVERYRGAPVYRVQRASGVISVDAGTILDCFEAVAASLRETVGNVLGRQGQLAGEPLLLVIAGGFSKFPLTAATVRDAVPDEWGNAGVRVMLLDETATATGAMLIGEGRIELAGPRCSVRLPAHRIRQGRLEQSDLCLTSLGRIGQMNGINHREAPSIEVASDHGAQLVVEVEGPAEGSHRPLALPPVSLPPGHYRLELWPAPLDFGTLVFRPVGKGDVIMCPLVETAGSAQRGGRS